MNYRATAQWSACARCLNGRLQGMQCAAGQVRGTFNVPHIDSDTARRTPHACGPHGSWQVYAAPAAGAPPLPLMQAAA